MQLLAMKRNVVHKAARIVTNTSLHSVAWWLMFRIHLMKLLLVGVSCGGIRGTVVACRTDGQQVEQSILRQGHDS